MDNFLARLTARVAILESKLNSMLRLCVVSAVNGDTVDIELFGQTLKEIPFLTWRAGTKGKTWWVPEVGESGLLLSPNGDVGNAVFLPGLFTDANLVPSTDINKMIRQFVDGSQEEYDDNDDTYMLSIGGDAARKVEKSPAKIKDTTGTTSFEMSQGKIKSEVSATAYEELTAILLNIVGAHFFTTGITSLITAVGPVSFAPAPSPNAAPTPPSGSEPDSEGKVTKIPKQTVSGVNLKAVSTITLPAIPITGTSPSGAVTGVTTAGSYSVTGTITLEFPAKDL